MLTRNLVRLYTISPNVVTIRERDQETMERNIDYLYDKEYEYLHFSDEATCNRFAEFVTQKYQITPTNRCCSGKGIGLRCDMSKIKELDKEFNEYEYSQFQPVIVDECKICFEEKTLVQACTVCKHPFCMDCIRQFKNRSCAICRTVT